MTDRTGMKGGLRALGLAAMLVAGSAAAQQKYDGYLCCNMRTDGSWISDSNYAENGKRVIPAGTPVRVTGYGRYRVRIVVEGEKQAIGNDYSRDLDDEAFARRYVVTTDPTATIASWPEKVRTAVGKSKVIVAGSVRPVAEPILLRSSTAIRESRPRSRRG